MMHPILKSGIVGLSLMFAVPAMAQGPQAGEPCGPGYGPCFGQGYGPGMGPGMMGPGYGWGGGMGPGMMGPGYGWGGGMGPGMMGREQGWGMMGPGYGWGGMGPGMMGPGWFAGRGTDAALSVDQVKTNLAARLQWSGNKRLKLGAVTEKDKDTIVAEIVTVENSLVARYEIDRHTGFMRAID